MAEVLNEFLSEQELTRLHLLSSSRLEALFLYDPHARHFEPAETYFSEDDLHMVMKATEALTRRVKHLNLSMFNMVDRQERKEWTMQYRFGPGELDLYDVFKQLLERDFIPAGQHRITEDMGLDGPILTITVVSHTEREYQETTDHITWLYDLAKRELRGEPYKGHRPY